MSGEEKKNNRIGLAVSLGAHALLLLIFLFILAYREPDPPLPQYGFEVNFGLSNAGSGDKQPETPPNNSDIEEDPAPEEPANTEPLEEQPAESEPENTESIPETVPEDAPAEPVESTLAEEAVTQPEPSEVTTAEPEEEVVQPKPEEPVENPVEEEQPAEEPQEEAQPQEPEESNPAAEPEEEVSTDGADGDTGSADSAPDSNQGNQEDALGDQGDPEGSLDSRALMGAAGGGGGPQLNMPGWDWLDRPEVQDDSDERGRIVFEITIDDLGEIVGIRTVEKTVTPAVEARYRQAVQKLTFVQKSDNGAPPPRSKGTITFIIKDQ